MSLVMMTDLLWFLHVEVVVAGKVGVQNEFLDFIVLRIKENVLKLSHNRVSPKIDNNSLSHHPHREVVVKIVGAESSRAAMRIWGVDLHLVLRFVENLKHLIQS